MRTILLTGISVSALATSAASAQGVRETDGSEIVVTAERTDRSLKDTASSVAVDRDADIARRAGDQSTNDLLTRIPNVVAIAHSNQAPAVRGVDGTGPGIGGNAFFAGTRPRLNFQVDGRTLTFNEAVYIDGGIWDISQFEVYRGPQSLLQGRNAIGGVVAIKTADPTYEWQGRARAAIGEFDSRQFGAAIGGPLIGQSLSFRLAGEYRSENSFIPVPAEAAPFDHPSRSRSKMVRGKLLLTPEGAPQLRSLLTLSYTDSYSPQEVSAVQPFKALDYGDPEFPSPRFRTRASVAISDTKWQVSDGIGLSLFATATDFRVNRYAFEGDGIAQIDGKEYSAEPRIRFGAAASPLSGFLAGYLFRAHQTDQIDLLGDRTFRDRTKTDAVFGELIWKPSGFLDLTGGARYETERRRRVGGATIFQIDYRATFREFLPRGTLTLHPSEAVSAGVTIGKGYNAGGAGFAFNPPFPTFTYKKEEVWNYEGFVRARFGKLQVDANVFYNDYSDLQLPFDVAQDPQAPAIVIRNASKATTYGAELELRYAALRDLDLSASAGLLKTKVNRYDDPSIQGNDLPRSPAFQFDVGIVGRPFAGMEASFDVRYTDSYFSDVFNQARGKTDPYLVGNARLSYRIGPVRLFVGAKNIFNTRQALDISPGEVAADDAASVLEPRRVTGGIDLTF